MIETPLRETLREAVKLCMRDCAHHAHGDADPAPILSVREEIDNGDHEHGLTVILDTPERAAAWVAKSRHLGEREALIFTSRCYVGAVDAVRAGGAKVYSTQAFLNDPAATACSLFGDLRLALEPSRMTALCDAFAARVAAALAMGSLAPLTCAAEALGLLRTDERGLEARAWWDRTLFRWGDNPDEPCPARLDVTGAARILAFGPFISVPPGAWQARLEFEVSADAARRSYLVEFGAGSDLSRVAFGPLRPGHSAVSVTHRFAAPAPAEIRLWVARAAFHGDLSFKGVSIEAASTAVESPTSAV